MPARIISFDQLKPKSAEFCLLMADLPGRRQETIGVLLLDKHNDQLHLRLRRDYDSIATSDDAEVLAELEADLAAKSNETGATSLLAQLEESCSLAVRLSDREAVSVLDFEKSVNDLYRQHVSTTVRPFRTHLPRYALAVAAGPFLANAAETEAAEWVETPEDLALRGDMFIATICGHSMEPRIPDGSLCVFRKGVVGSRNNRLVLVRNNSMGGDEAYTVKRYRSEKTITEDGFAQTRIRLESLNPAYPSWDLDQDETRYEVVAEFVCVLP
jgi:phage repressor protein C with HTH and peptisase S24 domain